MESSFFGNGFVASLQDDYFGHVCAKPPSIQSLMYNYREDLLLAMGHLHAVEMSDSYIFTPATCASSYDGSDLMNCDSEPVSSAASACLATPVAAVRSEPCCASGPASPVTQMLCQSPVPQDMRCLSPLSRSALCLSTPPQDDESAAAVPEPEPQRPVLSVDPRLLFDTRRRSEPSIIEQVQQCASDYNSSALGPPLRDEWLLLGTRQTMSPSQQEVIHDVLRVIPYPSAEEKIELAAALTALAKKQRKGASYDGADGLERLKKALENQRLKNKNVRHNVKVVGAGRPPRLNRAAAIAVIADAVAQALQLEV